MATPRNVAVILAGGLGTRLDHSVPKQLLQIGDRSIIEHAIAAFAASDLIDDIVVVMVKQHLAAVRRMVDDNRYRNVTAVIAGGQTRTESTTAALDVLRTRYVDPDAINVLIHDAARPLVTDKIIADVVTGLTEFSCVTPALEVADTIAVVVDDHMSRVVDRTRLRRVQTPQGFRLSVLLRAYERASADPDFVATDDCSVVLRYLPHVDIAVVDGDERNMKVTRSIDLVVAARLAGLPPQ